MANIVLVPCHQYYFGPQVFAAPSIGFSECFQSFDKSHPNVRLQLCALQVQCAGYSAEPPKPQPESSFTESAKGQPEFPNDQLLGKVWELSRTKEGCRIVQRALEEATCDNSRTDIAGELMGHVWSAVRCPNANHVIQKCISTLRPASMQFTVDEITCKGPNGVRRITKDRYGCRVVQRLLEHCRPDQLVSLVDCLLDDAIALSRHIYGHFVMQHLVEYGTQIQSQRFLTALGANVALVAADIHGSAVVNAALSLGPNEESLALVRSVLRESGLIVAMASVRHGHVAVKRLLERADGADLANACIQLESASSTLRESRYGRQVLASLMQRLELNVEYRG